MTGSPAAMAGLPAGRGQKDEAPQRGYLATALTIGKMGLGRVELPTSRLSGGSLGDGKPAGPRTFTGSERHSPTHSAPRNRITSGPTGTRTGTTIAEAYPSPPSPPPESPPSESPPPASPP